MILKNVTPVIFLCFSVCTIPLYGAAQEEPVPQLHAGLTWGHSARQGRRKTMEDTCAAVVGFAGNPNSAFFGVYDGHGGSEVALAVAQGTGSVKPFHVVLAECGGDSIPERFKSAFSITEKSILAGKETAGTTAVTALLDSEAKMLTIAWAGDSRAVVVQGNSILATTDHKPDSLLEIKRIENVNGYISYPQGPRHAYLGGQLGVSRALGDKKLKKGWGRLRGLTAKPEVGQIKLTDENAFAIFACDGVWDVLSNKEAARIVAGILNASQDLVTEDVTPKKRGEKSEEEGNNTLAILAARALRDAAFSKGSSDNLSVIVIQINRTHELFPTDFSSEADLKAIIGATPSDDEISDDELTGVLNELGW